MGSRIEWKSKHDEDKDFLFVSSGVNYGFVALAFVDTDGHGPSNGAELDASDTLDAAKTLLAILNAKTGSSWNAWNGSDNYAKALNQRDAAISERDALVARVAALEGELAAKGKTINVVINTSDVLDQINEERQQLLALREQSKGWERKQRLMRALLDKSPAGQRSVMKSLASEMGLVLIDPVAIAEEVENG